MDYSFTITLKPIMYQKDIDYQHDETANELYVCLKLLSNKFSLVAELTSSMNVHYHGIIQLAEGGKRKFVNQFRGDKKFGYVCLKPITNLSGWCLYIKKDIKTTMDELCRRLIIEDDYNVFTLEERFLYGRTY